MLSRSLATRCCYASSSKVLLHRPYTAEPASRASPIIKSPHNQAIVDLLVRSLEEEEGKPDANPFKLNAFNKAIASIRTLDRPIRSGSDVRAIQGIGPGIISRINNHLFQVYAQEADRDIETYNEVKKNRTVALFNDIPTIGPKKANDLVDAGCLSLDDLLSGKFNPMLSPKQILNIKYVHQLQQPILRQQAEDVLVFCRHHFDSIYQFDLVGDYRRGIGSFADINIMISHPSYVHIPLPTDPPFGTHIKKDVVVPKVRKRRKRSDTGTPTNVLHSDVVPMLRQAGFISDLLSSDSRSWKGIARLPGQFEQWGTLSERLNAIRNAEGHFRRVVFSIVPQRSIASSQLCLTGNQKFEKYMCYRAQRKGMLLNEYGLWRWVSNESSFSSDMAEHNVVRSEVDLHEPRDGGYWALIKCSSEEDIFRQLGMDYVEPTKRTLSYLFKIPKIELEVDEIDEM